MCARAHTHTHTHTHTILHTIYRPLQPPIEPLVIDPRLRISCRECLGIIVLNICLNCNKNIDREKGIWQNLHLLLRTEYIEAMKNIFHVYAREVTS